jgi:hypothetical protein
MKLLKSALHKKHSMWLTPPQIRAIFRASRANLLVSGFDEVQFGIIDWFYQMILTNYSCILLAWLDFFPVFWVLCGSFLASCRPGPKTCIQNRPVILGLNA